MDAVQCKNWHIHVCDMSTAAALASKMKTHMELDTSIHTVVNNECVVHMHSQLNTTKRLHFSLKDGQ